jgi:hypothetical protein
VDSGTVDQRDIQQLRDWIAGEPNVGRRARMAVFADVHIRKLLALKRFCHKYHDPKIARAMYKDLVFSMLRRV